MTNHNAKTRNFVAYTVLELELTTHLPFFQLVSTRDFFRFFAQPAAKGLSGFKSILSDVSCTKLLAYPLLLLNSKAFIDFESKINDPKTGVRTKFGVISRKSFPAPIHFLDTTVRG